MHSRRVEGDDCANAVVNSTEASACEIWQTANSTMLTDFSFTSRQNLENDTELRSLQVWGRKDSFYRGVCCIV